MDKKRLLVIDDEPGFRDIVRSVGQRMGLEVSEAANGKDYLTGQKDTDADIIVLDIVMPGTHGLELLDYLHAHHGAAKLVLVTGKGQVLLEGALEIARHKGLKSVTGLTKPIPIETLEAALAL